MSNLPLLYNVPKQPSEWFGWTFANMDSHRLIVLGLQAKLPGQRFDLFTLDPLPETDIPNWLQRHQAMHNQMDAVLGIGGNDFTGLNFQDTQQLEYLFQLHANEHIQAHVKLGITG